MLFTMGMTVEDDFNDNFIKVGNGVKIARAKQFGHWFLNETSDSCIVQSAAALANLQHR